MGFFLLLVVGLGAYAYGVWYGSRAAYRKGYERGQDDTVARLIV